MIVTKVQLVVETQTIIVDVNVVDVNLSTKSKVIVEQLFKDREPRKTKHVADWEKEKRLKQSNVETIQ